MPFDSATGNVPDKYGKILLAASDVIRRNGWTQHDFRNDAGGVCAVGAMSMVLHGKPVPLPEESIKGSDIHTACLRLLAVVRRRDPSFTGGVPTWNDSHCQSAEELIQTLEEAAFTQEMANAV